MLKYARDSKVQSLVITTIAYVLALSAAILTYRILPAGYSLLTKTLFADISATIVVFIFSFIFNNASFYDPYWSVAPPVIYFFWLYQGADGIVSARYILVLLITLFWGIRLTLNWAIGWPGFIHEDWRYVTFREKFKSFYWPISFLAIHFFPTMTVFLCSIPVYLVLKGGSSSLNFIDVIALFSGLTAIYFEWRSDYELVKHRKSKEGSKPIESGLWKISRHPNYFGEILFWFSLYFFSLASSPDNYWIGLAPVAMLCLFLFYSIPAMEKRQLQRRPEYRKIQKKISKLIPFPPKR